MLVRTTIAELKATERTRDGLSESHLPLLGAAGRDREHPRPVRRAFVRRSTGGGGRASRRHHQRPRDREVRPPLRTGRGDRHRSATGRPARAAASHVRLRAQLLPLHRVRSSRFSLAVQPGEGRRPGTPPAVARARGRSQAAWRGAPTRRRYAAAGARNKAAGQTPRRVAGPVRVPFLGARADDGRGQNGASHGAPIGPGANDFTADLRAPAAAVDPVPRVRGSGVQSRPCRGSGAIDDGHDAAAVVVLGRAGPAGHSAAGLLLVGVPDVRRRRFRGAGSPSRAARAAPGGRQASDGHQSSRLCASAAARDGSARDRHRTGRRAARRRHQIGRLDRCDAGAVPDGAGAHPQHSVEAGNDNGGWRSHRRPADLRCLARRRAPGHAGWGRRLAGTVDERAQSGSAPSSGSGDGDRGRAGRAGSAHGLRVGTTRRGRSDQPAAAPGAAQSSRQRALSHEGLRQVQAGRVHAYRRARKITVQDCPG